MPLRDVQSLGYVILLCEDLTVMRDFYRDVLGLRIHDEADDWVEILLGVTRLSMRPRGRGYDGELSGKGASIQLSFEVAPAQVYEAHETLLKANADICEPPKDQSFGHRTLYFRDPERNILEIYANL